MNYDHYTYRVSWSAEDGEHVATCLEFPSLSWLAETPEAALAGMRQMVANVIIDMKETGERIPVALAEKHYSGEFRVRIPPELHRQLALTAAEQGVSLNRLASMRLAGGELNMG
jgi:predicted HicB family RNase H-like nuclease